MIIFYLKKEEENIVLNWNNKKYNITQLVFKNSKVLRLSAKFVTLIPKIRSARPEQWSIWSLILVVLHLESIFLFLSSVKKNNNNN